MPQLAFLHDVVILFGVALVVIAASSRLHVPPVVGFLLTGMLVGPHGLALIQDVETVKVFAELGVVFLLFIVGLELSPARLRKLSRVLLVGGSIQTAATVAAVTLAGVVFGYDLRHALFFSFLVTLSSTAVVLKLYSERRELETPHGESIMGILLFQDFMIVPLLMVVPVLAGTGTTSVGEFALRFGGGLAVVGVFFALGRYLLPHVLHILVHTRIRELIVIGALFACLGGGVLTETLGFSLALGAFIAGLMIAESDYRYQVLAETASFRDVFNSMFFISVGMLLSVDFALDNVAVIVAVAVGAIVLKAAGVLLAVSALQQVWRTRIICALALAQASEFSFVLLTAGDRFGLLDTFHYQVAMAAAVLSMAITPLLVALAPGLAHRLGAAGVDAEAAEAPPAHGRVVVVGFGHSGQRVAAALRQEGISFNVVDANGRTVRRARTEGVPILYGDCTRREIMEKAGTEEAEIGVFSISDRTALRDAISLARELNPGLHILARARSLAEGDDLRAAGADEVTVDSLEASIKSLALTLTRLQVADERIRSEILQTRQSAMPAGTPPPTPA